MDAGMLIQLYKSTVLPILEYGNVWGPRYVSDKPTMQKIQIRRATKYGIELIKEETCHMLIGIGN